MERVGGEGGWRVRVERVGGEGGEGLKRVWVGGGRRGGE